jgi:hypothetical protein
MLLELDGRDEIDNLANRLADATRVTAGLFAQIIAASPRLITLKAIGKTGRLDRLLACEAWTDAAIELLALEAPGWSVKRLFLEDREWLCTLTRFPDVPDWLDDSAEGCHPMLALAVLDALLDIRAREVVTAPALCGTSMALASTAPTIAEQEAAFPARLSVAAATGRPSVGLTQPR